MYKSIITLAAAAMLAGCTHKDNTSSSMGQNDRDNGSMDAKDNASLNDQDRMFVHDAAVAGMAEVKAGQLAQSQGTNDRVRNFAQQMVTDHSNANGQLKSLASEKGLTLPTNLDAKMQGQLDELNKLNGNEFDKTYLNGQVADHKEVIAMFQKEAKSGQDPDLKAFASRMLPTLQHHLDMANAANEGKDMPRGNGM